MCMKADLFFIVKFSCVFVRIPISFVFAGQIKRKSWHWSRPVVSTPRVSTAVAEEVTRCFLFQFSVDTA